ncbi:MAG: hypothetical protein ACK5LG_21970 [Bacteroides thetaiotaomicron]
MQNSVEALEKQKEGNLAAIKRRDQVIKLMKNADFRKLIMEEFCVNECARYAQMSADPNLDADARADCLGIAQAAGHLRRWFHVIEKMGNTAEDSMVALEQELDFARSGGEDETEE